MRSALGLILADLMLMAAGVGVLQMFGALDLNPRRVAPALGLALITGIAAVLLLSIALMTVGLRLGLFANTLICLLFAVGGVVAVRRRPADRAESPDPAGDPPGSIFWPMTGWKKRAAQAALAVASLGLLAFAVVAVRRYSVPPAEVFDEFAIWSKKAVALYHLGGLEHDFFAGQPYIGMHEDYPILLPAMEAFIFHFIGSADTATMHVQFLVLLGGFIGSAVYLCARPGRGLLFVPLLLSVAIMPGLHKQLVSGYADVPLGLFVAIGALMIGLWLEDGHRDRLLTGALLLGAATNVKSEGLFAAMFVFAGAGAVLAGRRAWPDLKRLALAAGGFVLLVLPWQIWVKLHPDIQSFFHFANGFNPRFLWDSRENASEALSTMYRVMVGNPYNFVLPIGLAISVACLFARRTRAISAYYLIAAIGTFGALLWTYWVEPIISLDRIIVSVIFLAIAAALQLTGSSLLPARDSED